MYLVPLNQIESVELVIHALRAAGGEADCSTCPTRQVCMKQCLTIAGSIETMLTESTLPSLDPTELEPAGVEAAESPEQDSPVKEKTIATAPVNHLKVIK